MGIVRDSRSVCVGASDSLFIAASSTLPLYNSASQNVSSSIQPYVFVLAFAWVPAALPPRSTCRNPASPQRKISLIFLVQSECFVVTVPSRKASWTTPLDFHFIFCLLKATRLCAAVQYRGADLILLKCSFLFPFPCLDYKLP